MVHVHPVDFVCSRGKHLQGTAVGTRYYGLRILLQLLKPQGPQQFRPNFVPGQLLQFTKLSVRSVGKLFSLAPSLIDRRLMSWSFSWAQEHSPSTSATNATDSSSRLTKALLNLMASALAIGETTPPAMVLEVYGIKTAQQPEERLLHTLLKSRTGSWSRSLLSE